MDVRRQQTSFDLPAIREINRQAFDRSGSSDAFERIREADDEIVSLVAIVDGQIVGHVLFCPATVEGPDGTIEGMALGQLAVLPDYQRQGIGNKLATGGLDILREQRCPFVIVVGHASYYPRFGFRPGCELGLQCQWDGIPDDSFMALFMEPSAMQGAAGVARFVGIP